jgi:ribulose-5-phosphate 4-epimerase/fuculose-1-phosphate aldolase
VTANLPELRRVRIGLTPPAVLLANHGPVVAGRDVEAACNAIEELEATAKLALLTRGLSPRLLTGAQVRDIVTTCDVEWDA